MDFQLGDEVWQPDGGKLGELKRVVVDPDTGQVVSLIVLESRVDGAEVVAPIGLVDTAEIGSVILATDQYQFDSLDRYAGLRNLAPLPDTANITRDEITDPVDVPDVPPIGAATGVESIAYTPILEEDVYVPANYTVLDGSTQVYTMDGEAGRLHSVRVQDDSERIESLIATSGLIFENPLVIPFEDISSIQSDTIVLNVPRSALKDLDGD